MHLGGHFAFQKIIILHNESLIRYAKKKYALILAIIYSYFFHLRPPMRDLKGKIRGDGKFRST